MLPSHHPLIPFHFLAPREESQNFRLEEFDFGALHSPNTDPHRYSDTQQGPCDVHSKQNPDWNQSWWSSRNGKCNGNSSQGPSSRLEPEWEWKGFLASRRLRPTWKLHRKQEPSKIGYVWPGGTPKSSSSTIAIQHATRPDPVCYSHKICTTSSILEINPLSCPDLSCAVLCCAPLRCPVSALGLLNAFVVCCSVFVFVFASVVGLFVSTQGIGVPSLRSPESLFEHLPMRQASNPLTNS